MRDYEHRKTSLYLVEFIIVLLVMAVVSVVCIRLFFKSSDISKGAYDLNAAVTRARNAAEVFLSTDIDSVTYFDSDWNETAEQTQRRVEVTSERSGELVKIHIAVLSAGEVLYELDTAKWMGGGDE